ncbi:hypothetical protein BF49_0483 [Bradyrhizobium sp.]|nr:hypothetical protein BF49_0483 [Bradyrhizobium sp.]
MFYARANARAKWLATRVMHAAWCSPAGVPAVEQSDNREP